SSDHLILRHRLGVLAVEHDPAIAKRPAWTSGALLAREAVLDAEEVAREGAVVEDVPERLVEAVVLIVGDLEDTVLDPKGVLPVLAELVVADLHLPAVEVLAVEALDPVPLGLLRGRVGRGSGLGGGRLLACGPRSEGQGEGGHEGKERRRRAPERGLCGRSHGFLQEPGFSGRYIRS